MWFIELCIAVQFPRSKHALMVSLVHQSWRCLPSASLPARPYCVFTCKGARVGEQYVLPAGLGHCCGHSCAVMAHQQVEKALHCVRHKVNRACGNSKMCGVQWHIQHVLCI